ncbi:MAG: hypothetical protein WDN00_18190 [Limisphaerales bacterium]
MESGQGERSVDGLTARETFQAIVTRVRRMVATQYDCWREDLKPTLAKHNIRILEMDDLTATDLGWLEEYYLTKIRPVLTPLAIDPAHPFPTTAEQVAQPDGAARNAAARWPRCAAETSGRGAVSVHPAAPHPVTAR